MPNRPINHENTVRRLLVPAAAPRRPFTALWASQAFSNLADGLLQAAAPLLVATLTRDPLVVAGMTVVQFLPWLIATLPAGALADRVDRRRILTAGNWLRATGFALLAVALTNGWRHVALLYAAVFLAGCAETMVDNAALTIPPRLLPREQLERANGRLFATQSVINTFIGPPAGAALFALAASAAFYTGAAAFALAGLAALVLPALRPTGENQRRRSTPTTVTQDIRSGWAHFWRHDLLRRVAFISAAINFFGSATGGLLVLLITGPYELPLSRYGLFVAVPAAGAIAGSLLAEHVVPRIGGGPTTWLAALAEPDRRQHPAPSSGVRRTPRPCHRRLPAGRPGCRPPRRPRRRPARTRSGDPRHLHRRSSRTRARRAAARLPGHHPGPP